MKHDIIQGQIIKSIRSIATIQYTSIFVSIIKFELFEYQGN